MNPLDIRLHFRLRSTLFSSTCGEALKTANSHIQHFFFCLLVDSVVPIYPTCNFSSFVFVYFWDFFCETRPEKSKVNKSKRERETADMQGRFTLLLLLLIPACLSRCVWLWWPASHQAPPRHTLRRGGLVPCDPTWPQVQTWDFFTLHWLHWVFFVCFFVFWVLGHKSLYIAQSSIWNTFDWINVDFI